MTSTGTIVDFASGRSIEGARQGPHTVAGIAEKLYRGLKRRGALPRSSKPVCVSLPALCGVADDTIHRLSTIVAAGALTPESAARMALRHARETGIGRPSSTVGRRRGRYELSVAGDSLENLAVRIGAGIDGPWVVATQRASLGELLGLCPDDGRAICLLVRHSSYDRFSVHVVTTPSWQVTLIGRSLRPDWRLLRHIMVVGGLRAIETRQNAIGAAIAGHLKTRAHVRHVSRMAELDCQPDEAAAAPIIQLMAIALPGLMLRSHLRGRP